MGLKLRVKENEIVRLIYGNENYKNSMLIKYLKTFD